MCENPKNIWTPGNYDEDAEVLPRGLYRAEDLGSQDYTEPKNIELVGLTTQPAKIARAVLAGKPPNLIGSALHYNKNNFREGYHAPLFDFDFPMRYKNSSTRGNTHVLVDLAISSQAYKNVLQAMNKAGLQQWGFVNQMEQHEQTFLRWNAIKET